MADFGKDIGRSEQEPAKTPQEELEEIWRDPRFWSKGQDVQLTEPLPEGMRMVAVDPDFYVLRSPLPGVPIDPNTGKPQDVPIAVFGPNVDPKNVEEKATKLGEQIKNGEVSYVPPEKIIMR